MKLYRILNKQTNQFYSSASKKKFWHSKSGAVNALKNAPIHMKKHLEIIEEEYVKV